MKSIPIHSSLTSITMESFHLFIPPPHEYASTWTSTALFYSTCELLFSCFCSAIVRKKKKTLIQYFRNRRPKFMPFWSFFCMQMIISVFVFCLFSMWTKKNNQNKRWEKKLLPLIDLRLKRCCRVLNTFQILIHLLFVIRTIANASNRFFSLSLYLFLPLFV